MADAVIYRGGDEIQFVDPGIEDRQAPRRAPTSPASHFSLCQRFRKQKGPWLEHLKEFKGLILLILLCSLSTSAIFGVACGIGSFYIHLVVNFMIGLIFGFYWLFIPEGPPFFCGRDGIPVRAEYFSPRFGPNL